MHLRQPIFTYSTCGPLTRIKETIQKFKEAVDSRFIYKNELEKACFQHDIWLMEILRICLEQVLIMYYEIKHLILLKILNLMDTNVLQYIDLL